MRSWAVTAVNSIHISLIVIYKRKDLQTRDFKPSLLGTEWETSLLLIISGFICYAESVYRLYI